MVACAAIAPFLVTATGEFVYDDVRQIVQNPLIQDPARLGEALTSDVWAFSGLREGAASNYWRPAFVLWLAIQETLFGLDGTLGWHLASILLHVAVTLLACRLALRLGLQPPTVLLIGLLLAVHPTRVESVAWISGSPDLLAALAVLAALLLTGAALATERGTSRLAWTGALLAASVGMLAKEIVILLPVLIGALVVTLDPGGWRRSGRRALAAGALFAIPAVLFLIARRWVLGTVQVEASWNRGLGADLASAPSVILFYLRQVFWPVGIGPSYPLRAVADDAPSGAIAGPLVLLLALVGVALYLTRGDRLARFGLLFFATTLLPALHIDAFHPEQIVHDRYLYLPLVGFALALGATVERRLLPRLAPATATRRVVVGALVLAVPLALLTARAARPWRSEVALWEHGVRTDPTSAFNHLQLAEARRQAGDVAGAGQAIARAAQLAPTRQVVMGRADVALEQGRLTDALADLERLYAASPADPRIAERYAIALARAGRPGDAEQILRRAREVAPGRRCALTSNLARILAMSGREAEARDELLAVRNLVPTEANENCRQTLALLADLELRAGRPQEARRALEELLAVTATLDDPQTRQLRESARRGLERLPPP